VDNNEISSRETFSSYAGWYLLLEFVMSGAESLGLLFRLN